MKQAKASMLFAAISAILVSGHAISQDSANTFPSKPVTVIIPVAAGGPLDNEARTYLRKLDEFTGKSFITDYKLGAGGAVAGAYVAKAAPDGYTLLAMNSAFATLPALYKDLSFDMVKDFAFISQMSERASTLLVYPAFPPKNFTEYIAYAKAHPGKINFGTTGAGAVGHLVGAWMHSATDTTVTFVHYKGTAVQLPDLIAGRLDIAMQSLPAALPLIKAGKARALSMVNKKRSKLLPNVPTISEQGLPDFGTSTWFGFVAPAATPTAIINKLNGELVRVAKSPDVVQWLSSDGTLAIGSTSAQFRQLMSDETTIWQRVVQKAGITLN